MELQTPRWPEPTLQAKWASALYLMPQPRRRRRTIPQFLTPDPCAARPARASGSCGTVGVVFGTFSPSPPFDEKNGYNQGIVDINFPEWLPCSRRGKCQAFGNVHFTTEFSFMLEQPFWGEMAQKRPLQFHTTSACVFSSYSASCRSGETLGGFLGSMLPQVL